MAKNPDLYKKRYKTLKEHRAAVAARKTLKGGKNKGPVANAAAYGETIKKPKVKPIPKLSKKQKSIAAQSGNPNKIEASDLKKLRSSKGKERFFAGAKGGKFDKAVKNKDKAIRNFSQSASGTRGELRPSNPPSPTVLRRGSKTGASVDPRERGLKKNQQSAKRTKGSSSKGRKNIAAQVKAASGSSKRNQKTVEARRRRARTAGLRRNVREYLAAKNKDM